MDSIWSKKTVLKGEKPVGRMGELLTPAAFNVTLFPLTSGSLPWLLAAQRPRGFFFGGHAHFEGGQRNRFDLSLRNCGSDIARSHERSDWADYPLLEERLRFAS
jgi:hypothetical protein